MDARDPFVFLAPYLGLSIRGYRAATNRCSADTVYQTCDVLSARECLQLPVW